MFLVVQVTAGQREDHSRATPGGQQYVVAGNTDAASLRFDDLAAQPYGGNEAGPDVFRRIVRSGRRDWIAGWTANAGSRSDGFATNYPLT